MGMSSGVSETFLTEQVSVVSSNGDAANRAISGFTRVSQLLTLFDGKILNAEDPLKPALPHTLTTALRFQ